MKGEAVLNRRGEGGEDGERMKRWVESEARAIADGSLVYLRMRWMAELTDGFWF